MKIIGPKTQKQIYQYLYKNTKRAKYNRTMDLSFVAGLPAMVEICRIGHWGVLDFPITACLTLFSAGVGLKGLKQLVELQPLRWRAIKIKKAAAKLSQKLNKKV